MTSVTGTPGSIEATTALLLSELPRLEAQQQTLENELAAVTERLGSVRAALTALQALSAAPHVPEPAVSPEAVAESGTEHGAPAEEPVEQPAEESAATAAIEETAEDTADTTGAENDAEAAAGDDAKSTPVQHKVPRARASRKTPAEAPKERKRRTAKKTVPATADDTTADAAADAAGADQPAGGLTEQILAVLAGSADTPVRARDVAQALGRDESPGSINAVRSTLDRLVGSSRAHRAGRGLYQAVQG
ncbi:MULTISPECIES: hypothetical protein [unclassified Streptomyces]|uniref:hypothetical protein n=1 Tax=unclassified Streptomyces TaxID=2593676 RepID=UPI00081EF4CE|nr:MULTISPECIES: hypothetical protein [unclassified Streptomyces]MYZ37995.1 hypothetical protein [Streptomyces sp. SID4917]SCF95600.1 hypothetical protein GA0115259_105544 [Streptomyces sp. MnatMP-M17]